VEAAVGAILTLRAERRTAEYQTPERRVFYGLLPQSISHEGYSAKPMHSYWDDFFALKGLKDAAFLAEALGKPTSPSAGERRGTNSAPTSWPRSPAPWPTTGSTTSPAAPSWATSTPLDDHRPLPGRRARESPRAAVERTFERY